jgi:S1-C subfamily serine protease
VKLLAVMALAACVSLPHVPAAPRGYAERERAAVRVDMACNVAGIPGWEDEPHFDDWTIGHTGSGVVIDERHVLTAAHVTACPTLPGVMLTTWDGRHLQAVVTQEDRDRDFAVLELASADRMHLDVSPPAVTHAAVGAVVCIETAEPTRAANCGPVAEVLPGKGGIHVNAIIGHGNSGSGVYDTQGRLVGIAVNMTGDYAGVTSWP